MQTITETDLIHAAELKAIISMRIEETKDCHYQVYVVTTGDESEKVLTTLRDRSAPREWVSLDRLVRHIKNRYGYTPNICLNLHADNCKGDMD